MQQLIPSQGRRVTALVLMIAGALGFLISTGFILLTKTVPSSASLIANLSILFMLVGGVLGGYLLTCPGCAKSQYFWAAKVFRHCPHCGCAHPVSPPPISEADSH